MTQDFLFVFPVQPTETQKQKELRYAAAKAHIQRNVHRTRQRGFRDQRPILKHKVPSSSGSLANSFHQTSPVAASEEDNFLTSRVRPLTTFGTPNPVVWCGNSDPFACQLFPVTPLLNQTISFARFHTIRSWSPSFMLRLVSESTRYCPLLGSHGSTVGLQAATFLWELLASDVGAFWSVVASVVPLMISIMPEQARGNIRKVTLLIKARSLVLIREALSRAENPSGPSTILIYQIKALFREACMSGDTVAAKYHAKILRHLTQQIPFNNDFRDLRIALWNDGLPALLQLRRPVVDQSEWMPEMLARTWRLGEAALPDSALVYTQLPDSICNSTLRAAILHIRHALYVGSVSMMAEHEAQIQRAEVIFHWVTSKAEFHINHLLNFYFDIMTPGTDVASSLTLGDRYTSAATALTLLCILQKSFCDLMQSDGTDLHDSAGVLHIPLLTLTQLALKHSSESERESFHGVHFWIVFIGAYCEEIMMQARQRTFSGADVGTKSHGPLAECRHSTWLQVELRKRASAMGLGRWSDAKLVLSRFVINELLEPKAELWFEATTMNE